jgi:glutamate carboxypeptidase
MEYNRRMEARSLFEYFQGQTEAFTDLMKRLIRLRTDSGEVEEINRFLDVLQNLFGEFNPQISRIQEERGDILTLTFFPERPDYTVFLAHVDTVSVSGIAPVAVVEGDLLKGNGSFDMKGGIALFYFAMKAIRHFRASPPAAIRIVFTPDEETGSPTSMPHLIETCRNARAVILPEPCCPDGGVKLRRKAIAQIDARLTGRASHSGIAPEKGLDANRALAKLILLFDGRIRAYPGMTFNPGVVAGGSKTNIVPPESRLAGEIRTFSNDDLRRFLDELEEIIEIDGVRIQFANRRQHPALEPTAPNRALFSKARKIMEALDYPLAEGASGGASDGSSLSAAGIPVLDGIGLKGDGAHAEGEFIRISDFPFRAVLISRLAEEV